MGFFRAIPPMFRNQQETLDFLMGCERAFDASDAGTGKTRSALEMIKARQKQGAGKALVLATKSTLKPAWGEDARKFLPDLRVSIAYASNRKKAFDADADVYITNHDAVGWIVKNLDLSDFDILVVDESTAYKHRTSQRSKAIQRLAKHFNIRLLMTGTANPNTVLDLWHQYFLLDDGERLNTNFFKFRHAVCEPIQVGPDPAMVKWHDKPGAIEAVADIVSDITIRHRLEDCHDLPPNHTFTVNFDLSAKHLALYHAFKETALLELKDTAVSAVNRAALETKLLQIASGAVYDVNGEPAILDTDRYELVLDLAEAREQCLIAFNWKHQRDELIKLAKKRGISYGLIDGTTKIQDRETAVEQFQQGKLKLLLAHPQSAGHGLTLTRGTTTIWSSPVATSNAEFFVQFNRRIYRAGQTRKTETLLVCANGTVDEKIYTNVDRKTTDMVDFLSILEAA